MARLRCFSSNADCTRVVDLRLLSTMLVFAPLPDGSYMGFWGYGSLVFFCAVLVPSLKILTFSNSFYATNILVLVGSVTILLVSMVVIDTQTSSSTFATLQRYARI